MVLTHLVQLKFYHGATVNEAVVPVTFSGHTTFPPFYAFKGFSVGEPVPEPQPSPTGQQEPSGGWFMRRVRNDEEEAELPAGVPPPAVEPAAAAPTDVVIKTASVAYKQPELERIEQAAYDAYIKEQARLEKARKAKRRKRAAAMLLLIS